MKSQHTQQRQKQEQKEYLDWRLNHAPRSYSFDQVVERAICSYSHCQAQPGTPCKNSSSVHPSRVNNYFAALYLVGKSQRIK